MDKDWVRKTTEVIEDLKDVQNFEPKHITSRITDIESSHDDEAHVQEIEKILESIRDGRLYQLNFGREWRGRMHGEPIEVFTDCASKILLHSLVLFTRQIFRFPGHVSPESY